MIITNVELKHVLEKVKLPYVTLVGDSVAIVYGIPAIPRDVDFSSTINMMGDIVKFLESNNYKYSIAEIKGYESKVYIVHTAIDGIPVDFNLETQDSWNRRYHGSVVVKDFEGIKVRVYELERYVAGKLKRIIEWKNNPISKYIIPTEIMDIVPIICRNAIKIDRVRYWISRIAPHIFGETIDSNLIEAGRQLACKYLECCEQSKIEECIKSILEFRSQNDMIIVRHAKCVNIENKIKEFCNRNGIHVAGGLLIREKGLDIYLRDIDIFVKDKKEEEKIREYLYSIGCRLIQDRGSVKKYDCNGCIVETTYFPEEIMNISSDVELWIATNISKISRRLKERPNDKVIQFRFLIKLYPVLKSTEVNMDIIDKIIMKDVERGYINEPPLVEIDKEAVYWSSVFLWYVYDLESYYGLTVDKIYSELINYLSSIKYFKVK